MAHRKYVLLSYLVHGKLSPLPSTVNSSIKRALEADAEPYVLFVTRVISCRHISKIAGVEADFRERFAKDGNSGLAKACVSMWPLKRIEELSVAFMTLPIEKVAESIGQSKAEALETLAGLVCHTPLIASVFICRRL